MNSIKNKNAYLASIATKLILEKHMSYAGSHNGLPSEQERNLTPAVRLILNAMREDHIEIFGEIDDEADELINSAAADIVRVAAMQADAKWKSAITLMDLAF